nr:hypothetical protein [Bacilli bacterium]
KQYNVEPLYSSFSFKYEYQSTYYSDEIKDGITDYFILEKTCKIVGICKEISFLSTPKMYYSYLAFKEYLSSVYLNNLSTYFNRDYSWIDRIDECNESEEISSYSFKLFHKDYQQFNKIEEDMKKIEEPFAVTSTGKIRTDALLGLVSAASVGMELFMVIALIGTALIMGIVSFSFYSEDKKKIAILHCLGSDIGSVNDIYSLENMFIGLLAFIGTIIISPLLQFVINLLIKKWFGFSNIIAIPILKLHDIPLGLPVLVLACTILLAILSTSLPIYFSKKISIKEELKDE